MHQQHNKTKTLRAETQNNLRILLLITLVVLLQSSVSQENTVEARESEKEKFPKQDCEEVEEQEEEGKGKEPEKTSSTSSSSSSSEMSAATKCALVVGANRGLGLEVVKALNASNKVGRVIGTTRKEAKQLTEEVNGEQNVIQGIDMEDSAVGSKLASALSGVKIDYLIHTAGLFYTGETSIEKVDVEQELKMYKICSIAPLLVVQQLTLNGNLVKDSKVLWVTSEGGSLALRDKPESGHYGHHASKAAQNMNGKMLSLELEEKGIPLVMVHPGFLKTEMTSHYSSLYEKFGAVTPDVAAKGIVDTALSFGMESTGKFVAPLGKEHFGLGAVHLPEDFKPGDEIPW